MLEKIYTIPVNEAFDATRESEKCECPLCYLHRQLENTEVDLILGASMMEPDVRIQTNEKGFCAHHFDRMFHAKNRLGLALILQSHLDTLKDGVLPHGAAALLKGNASIASDRIEKLNKTCYVCQRIDEKFEKMLANTALLWDMEREFKEKLADQKLFCLPHYRMLLEAGKRELPKKKFSDFQKALESVVKDYFLAIKEDIDLFIKKFDYRYEDTPWGNSKDSVERTIRFLKSEDHPLS